MLGPALAWQHDGVDGVAVAEEAWRPPKSEIEDARDELRRLGLVARIRDNRINLLGTTVQLRLGKNRSWYRFDRRGGDWELAAPPRPTLVEALDELGSAEPPDRH